MKPEVKELWVSALRDSDMKQGRGCLKEGNEFCCLGVLTELYRMSTANVKNLDWHQLTSISAESFDGTGMFLPRVVAEWAGLPGATRIILNDIWLRNTVSEETSS